MPIRQPQKKGENRPASIFSKDTGSNLGIFKKAAIFKIDEKGNILENKAGVFLLNPSAIEEVKSANWALQNTPGQSDPILQWISSGPRTVTFEALVTADTSDYDSSATVVPGEPSSSDNALNIIGDLASAFFGIKTPPPPSAPATANRAGDSLDITHILNYYRSLLYPIYDDINNPRSLRQSPPLVVLYFGKALIKKRYQKRISNNHDIWVVTNLSIRTTKQLPNLAPMEATVRFSLTQYTIKSFDSRRFTN